MPSFFAEAAYFGTQSQWCFLSGDILHVPNIRGLVGGRLSPPEVQPAPVFPQNLHRETHFVTPMI